MRQIILDTETTGLSPQQGHRIIEVGCIELINRKITGNNLHFYINPEREIDKGAQEVHGLSLDFLKDKPVFADIADKLFTYLNGAELVIHNAPFDIGFLNHEFKLLKTYGRITEYCQVIDTLMIARKKHPGQQNSLDALCRRYFVDNTDRELHGALLDARLLAQVYLLMTGGQAQMFDENQTNVAASEQLTATVVSQRVPLKIIRASAEELAAHEEFMKTVVK